MYRTSVNICTNSYLCMCANNHVKTTFAIVETAHNPFTNPYTDVPKWVGTYLSRSGKNKRGGVTYFPKSGEILRSTSASGDGDNAAHAVSTPGLT